MSTPTREYVTFDQLITRGYSYHKCHKILETQFRNARPASHSHIAAQELYKVSHFSEWEIELEENSTRSFWDWVRRRP